MTMRDAQVRKRGGISALLNRYGIELVFVILFIYGCFVFEKLFYAFQSGSGCYGKFPLPRRLPLR